MLHYSFPSHFESEASSSSSSSSSAFGPLMSFAAGRKSRRKSTSRLYFLSIFQTHHGGRQIMEGREEKIGKIEVIVIIIIIACFLRISPSFSQLIYLHCFCASQEVNLVFLEKRKWVVAVCVFFCLCCCGIRVSKGHQWV